MLTALPAVGSEETYFAHRDAIEHVIGRMCRRHALRPQDAEDFSGAVRLHLIEDDYAVLRRFEGRSSIGTYLAAVVAHFFQDWRNARWGKWRSSAEAKRLGPVAVQLERLVVRDGLSLDEAHETLRINFRVGESRQTLEALLARCPVRSGRHLVSDEALVDRPAETAPPDATLAQEDAARTARQAATALAAAVAQLPAQDRLILKLRFSDDFPIVKIARVLQLDQKALYRRLERLLRDLREAVLQAGVSGSQAAEALAARGFDRLMADEARTAEIWGEVRPFPEGAGGAPVQTVRTP